MNGIFNIYKPPGMTSHDVVAVVRRLSRQRRVGHAGTLDPMAEGVLLVCVGTATRVSEYLMAGRKRYLATVTLGISTTTDDAEGEVIRQVERVDLSRAEVEAALASFHGRVQQVPPSFSALKRGGQPMYKLARAGVKVDLQPRQVEIYEMRILNWQPPLLEIEVACSPGTYIRSVARDLGEKLGCGAHLSHLVRTESGRFTSDDAVTLDGLAEAFARDEWSAFVHPLDAALQDLDSVVVGSEAERLIKTGRPWCPEASERRPEGGTLHRVYSESGELIALAEYDADLGGYQPRKVLAS